MTELRGLGPAEPRDALEIRGEDRARFLHGYVTSDIKGLEIGRSCYTFFPTPQGKVRCDAIVLALEDRLWIDLPPGFGESIAAHLAKYVIADRVEIGEPQTMERRAIFGGEDLPPFAARTAADPRRGNPAVNVWVSPEQTSDLETWLAGRPLPFLTQHLLTTARVEAGIASFGIDFDDTRFPQETGAEADAVSYTKGCYLGQEVIARLHYRGQAQNVLRGLRFEGSTPEPGTALLHDGREAGRATSVADSPRLGAIGLAILHRRAEPASTVELSGGGQATVVELPFV